MSAEADRPQLNADDPWPGLDAFEESAHAFFHGRDTEAGEVARHVSDVPLTVLFGKSGLGKTSLLKAGVFPCLRKGRFLPVYIRFDIRPDMLSLVDQVADRLRAALEQDGIDAPRPVPGESLWVYLHRSGLEFWDSRNQLLTPVLVFDQFEEIFTLGSAVPDAVRAFRLDFGDLAENRIPASLSSDIETGAAQTPSLSLRSMPYRVIVSLREDFLPDLEGWRRSIPSLGRARVRLLPMGYEQAISAVFDTGSHLMDEATADRIVRFVAAEQLTSAGGAERDPHSDDQPWAVEPALLSLFCRGLNDRRKQQGKDRFDAALMNEAQQGIIADYYRSCIAELPERVSEFIENELITEKGFRNSYARDDAVPAFLTQAQLDDLTRKRLLRVEERYRTQRIELTHDVLTSAVREHRDWRRAEQKREAAAREVAEARRREAEASRERELRLEEERRVEREKRLEGEARAGRRFRRLAGALGLALIVAIGTSIWALSASGEAGVQAARANDEAAKALASASVAHTERARAEALLRRITDGIRMKQAVLSGDGERIQQFLSSDLANHSIRFSARANDLGYANPQGQRVFKFELFPVRGTLPEGGAAVAVITYRMNHPTFQNALLATGPDRAFTASYSGWGCLQNVIALIEYVDPQRSPEIASYDMCAAIGR